MASLIGCIAASKQPFRRQALARPSELVPGNCYFLLNYCDEDLLVPDVHTYLYVGPRDAEDGTTSWFFRWPSPSILEAASDGLAQTEEHFISFAEDSLYQILDLPTLIRELSGLAPFHPLNKPETTSTAPPSVGVSESSFELESAIIRLLEAKEVSAVTITIKYTDDGFSVGKVEDRLSWKFGLGVPTDAPRGKSIREILREHAPSPSADYLYNRGREQSLTFETPRSRELALALCKRLLREVYAMRADDHLRIHFHATRSGA